MKKLIITYIAIIILWAICTLAFADADNINYKEAVISTTFKKVLARPAVIETVTPGSEDGKIEAVTKEIEPAIYEMQLDIPFTAYSELVYCNGTDVTYSYWQNMSLDGQEAVVLVHYKIADDTDTVRKFAGFIGEDWATIKPNAMYKKHYSVTKADALATTAEDGTVMVYTGDDAAEAAPFYKGMCGSDKGE